MKKLSLDVDTLRVESFDTGDGHEEPGTVHAQSYTPATFCGTCHICPTDIRCPSVLSCYTCPNPVCIVV